MGGSGLEDDDDSTGGRSCFKNLILDVWNDRCVYQERKNRNLINIIIFSR